MYMKQVLDEVLGPADIVLEIPAKNCSDPFCNHEKEKRWKLPSHKNKSRFNRDKLCKLVSN